MNMKLLSIHNHSLRRPQHKLDLLRLQQAVPRLRRQLLEVEARRALDREALKGDPVMVADAEGYWRNIRRSLIDIACREAAAEMRLTADGNLNFNPAVPAGLTLHAGAS